MSRTHNPFFEEKAGAAHEAERFPMTRIAIDGVARLLLAYCVENPNDVAKPKADRFHRSAVADISRMPPRRRVQRFHDGFIRSDTSR